jgi:hypothetical protein
MFKYNVIKAQFFILKENVTPERRPSGARPDLIELETKKRPSAQAHTNTPLSPDNIENGPCTVVQVQLVSITAARKPGPCSDTCHWKALCAFLLDTSAQI